MGILRPCGAPSPGRAPLAPDSAPSASRPEPSAPRCSSITPRRVHSTLHPRPSTPDLLCTTIRRRSPTPDREPTTPRRSRLRLQGSRREPKGGWSQIRGGWLRPDSLQAKPDPQSRPARRGSPGLSPRRGTRKVRSFTIRGGRHRLVLRRSASLGSRLIEVLRSLSLEVAHYAHKIGRSPPSIVATLSRQLSRGGPVWRGPLDPAARPGGRWTDRLRIERQAQPRFSTGRKNPRRMVQLHLPGGDQ
jgi:hypothetical protein